MDVQMATRDEKSGLLKKTADIQMTIHSGGRFHFTSADDEDYGTTGEAKAPAPVPKAAEEVNNKDTLLMQTVFLTACSDGKLGLVLQQVSRYGVDVNCADYDKRTGLHVAASDGRAAVVEWLLKAGANPNPKDRFGRTPLDDAITYNHMDVVDVLRQHGAEATAFNQFEAEMIQAAAAGDMDVVKRLVKAGVDPNCADYDGRTPLHLAVANHRVEVARYLLSDPDLVSTGKRADPQKADRWGMTAMNDVKRRAARVGKDDMRDLFESLDPVKSHGSLELSKFVVFVGIWEAIMIIFFGIFTRYDETNDGGTAITDSSAVSALSLYPFYQDIHVMIFIGFGFLMTFLRRHSYTAVGITFLIGALSIQWYCLIEGFWAGAFSGNFHKIPLSIHTLVFGDFAAGCVLITFGVVIGKVSPFQMMFVTIVEILFYSLNEQIGLYLKISDIGGSMVIHMFGAFFGLAFGFVVTPKTASHPNEAANNKPVYHSDVFAMIGTVFLWMFWPSFNGGPGATQTQHRAVLNTVLGLTGSCMAAYLSSYFFRREKRFNMVDIQNATLAGGVALGASADLIILPGSAMGLGAVAGIVSVVGYVYVQPFLESTIGLQDTCGVLNLHGMPSIIGAIAGMIAAATASYDAYGPQMSVMYPARCATYIAGETCEGVGRSASVQAGVQCAYMFITLGIALSSGAFTGFLARGSFFDPPQADFFLDSRDWEVPEIELPYYFDHRGEISRDPEHHQQGGAANASAPEGNSETTRKLMLSMEKRVAFLEAQLSQQAMIAAAAPAPAAQAGGSKLDALLEKLALRVASKLSQD